MGFEQNRVVAALWARARSRLGVRFTRFAVAAIAALAASEITLTVCLGLADLTAGKAAVISWFAGAVTSYVLSRWAWERKGKPSLLKETLPFWAVSAVVIVILTVSTKFGNQLAISMHLSETGQVIFVDAVYLAANCVTFVMRFLIFHYVLFAERPGSRPAAPEASPAGDDGPFVMAGDTGPLAAVRDDSTPDRR
jgi:putative flippase GtrA